MGAINRKPVNDFSELPTLSSLWKRSPGFDFELSETESRTIERAIDLHRQELCKHWDENIQVRLNNAEAEFRQALGSIHNGDRDPQDFSFVRKHPFLILGTYGAFLLSMGLLKGSNPYILSWIPTSILYLWPLIGSIFLFYRPAHSFVSHVYRREQIRLETAKREALVSKLASALGGLEKEQTVEAETEAFRSLINKQARDDLSKSVHAFSVAIESAYYRADSYYSDFARSLRDGNDLYQDSSSAEALQKFREAAHLFESLMAEIQLLLEHLRSLTQIIRNNVSRYNYNIPLDLAEQIEPYIAEQMAQFLLLRDKLSGSRPQVSLPITQDDLLREYLEHRERISNIFARTFEDRSKSLSVSKHSLWDLRSDRHDEKIELREVKAILKDRAP